MQLNLYHARPVRVTDRDGAFFSGTAHFVPGTDGGQDALRVDQALISADRIAAVDPLPSFEDAAAAIPPGKYRHFKGKLYQVLFVARHSETCEPMVVYRALYGEGGVWTRPAWMWLETVTREGRTLPRFSRVPEDEAP